MCLLAIGIHVSTDYPLIIVSHRDEFFKRPAQALHRWDHAPIAAGVDLKAMGTWLGFAPNGRFGALTNLPDHPAPIDAPSRGRLVVDYLTQSQDAPTHLESLSCDAYAGFHLVLGNAQGVWRRTHPSPQTHAALDSGIHVFSNAPANATWPKLSDARHRFARALKHTARGAPDWLSVLDDRPERAPDDWDRSPADFRRHNFILGSEYGTVAITAALWSEASQQWDIAELGFDPLGTPKGFSRERW
jgi:uncharacterized protein with NRDE domain